MTTALSLHIAIEEYDQVAHGQDVTDLKSCIEDAEEFAKIAKGNQFTSQVLKDADTSAAKVEASILAAATALVAGDVFVLTFTGHGQPSLWGLPTAWVLQQELLYRDRLETLLGEFKAGVYVLLLSTCCHSAPGLSIMTARSILARGFFGQLFAAIRDVFFGATVNAHLIEIHACKDGDVTFDGEQGGHTDFGGWVIDTLNDSYKDFDEFFAKVEARAGAAGASMPQITPKADRDATFDDKGPFRRV